MKVLISERLSEHKYKTPEGYLICTDAILARTGKQRYTKDELFGDGDSEEVDVDRPYEQVMNEKTISSFENKPVTFDHPDEDVNVGNYKEYAVGYVRDVHQGKVDGQDVILGNLVITDQDAIDAIENGEHTDLSCGYECDIKDDGTGHYSQNNIRGNHVALCKEGRAGNARIVDSKVIDKKRWEVGHRVRYEGRWYYVIAYSKGDWVLEPENGSRGDCIYVRAEDSKSEDSIKDKQDSIKEDSYMFEDTFDNGKLKDFNIGDLIRLVKERKEAVNSIRRDDKGNIYYIVVGGYYDTDLNTGKNASLDVTYEDKETHYQKRNVLIARASSWKEIVTVFNRWKNMTVSLTEDRNKVHYYDSHIADRPEGAFKQISNALSSYTPTKLVVLGHGWKWKVSTTPQGIVADFVGEDEKYGNDPAEMSRISTDSLKQDLQTYLQSKMQQHIVTVNSASFIKTSHGGIGGVRFRIGTKLKRDSLDDSIKDNNIDDAWSGTRNGIIYSYHNGYYYITHENGKVERLPGSKFDKIEDLYKYVDNIKDSSNLSASKALKMIGIVSMLRKK